MLLMVSKPDLLLTRPFASGGGGLEALFLADQLSLSQPGGHIIPTQYYLPPRFSDLAMALPLHIENMSEVYMTSSIEIR